MIHLSELITEIDTRLIDKKQRIKSGQIGSYILKQLVHFYLGSSLCKILIDMPRTDIWNKVIALNGKSYMEDLSQI